MTTRIEINCTTGEILEIELTQAELDQRETDRIAYEMEQANRETEAAAKAVARTALLERLGISEEEAELLK
jgi:DNA-binding Xre family transcriptional regulator